MIRLFPLLLAAVTLLGTLWSAGHAPVQAASLWQWRPSGYSGGGRFTAAAIDPHEPNTVFIGSDVAGFFGSTDTAATFTPLGHALGGFAVADILIGPPTGRLLVLTDDGLYVSRDNGVSLHCVTTAVRYQDRQPGSHLLLQAPDGPVYAASDKAGVFRATVSGDAWQVVPLGLAGIKINGLALWGQTLYVATDQGVRRLEQGTFTDCDEGFPLANRQITDIAAVGGVLACLEKDTGFYVRSGEAWTAKGLPGSPDGGGKRPSYKNMAANPDKPGHFFVATHPAYWPHRLFETTDAGTTWRQITRFTLGDGGTNWATGLESTERITFSPDGTFGLLTDWWNVWRSLDGGQTWRQCTTGLQNTVVNAIAVHPTNPNRRYLATADNGLMRTGDGGVTWQRAMTGVVDGDAKAVVLAPGHPDTLYLLMTPWKTEGTGTTAFFSVYRSDDAGRTWRRYRFTAPRRTFAVGYADGTPQALAVAPDNPDRVYVAVNGYGIFVLDTASQPAGGDAAVVNITAGITNPYFKGAHCLLIPSTSPATLFSTTQDGGIYRTTDRGKTWRLLAGSQGFVFALAADPDDPAHLLAAAAQKTLLESRDGGEHWTKRFLPGDRPEEQPASDVIFGPAGSRQVFVGTSAYDFKAADGLFVSIDSGQHFARAESVLPRVGINTLALIPGQSDAVLVGFNGLGVYTVHKAH